MICLIFNLVFAFAFCRIFLSIKVDEKIFFVLRIIPEIITSFKTPINLITELCNNKKGLEKLIEINATEKLLSYLEKKEYNEIDKNADLIRSSMWIIAKLLLNNEFIKIAIKNYQYYEKDFDLLSKYKDYSLRGTFIYLISFSSQNRSLFHRNKIFNIEYYFDTNIGFWTMMDSLYIDKSIFYENDKLNDDMSIIENRIVKHNPMAQEIYNCISSLANNITFKQSLSKLEEIYRDNNRYLEDENLFIIIYAVLTKYKYKETARKAIMFYFEKSIL